MITTQRHILDCLIQEAGSKDDLPSIGSFAGAHMVAVQNQKGTGLCSRLPGGCPEMMVKESFNLSCHGLAGLLRQQNTGHACWGLAAVNSLLNPGVRGQAVKIQDLLQSLGAGKNVAVVGHFPFVDRIRGVFKNLWVLEKKPQSSDFPESMKSYFLPRADLVAITATTLLNSSLAEILALADKKAIKFMLGPSTPMGDSLLDLGLDYLGGIVVQDVDRVVQGIRHGTAFRNLEGISFMVRTRSRIMT